jgi:chorismate synthase
MNRFGTRFALSIFGESHGPLVGITIDGCLPGLHIDASDFTVDLNRRRGGMSAGTTSRSEKDFPHFVSGVFEGKTTGAPLTLVFYNEDKRSNDYESFRSIPRPGHADFVASKKFNGFEDFRGGGHFSGRMTLCLVAAGVVAKKQLNALLPSSNPVTIDAIVEEVAGYTNIEQGIAHAIEQNDSVGGIVSCRISNLPIGIGEPFFNSVESVIAHAAFSIPAIKGIEFGSGFGASKMKGSEHNDVLIDAAGTTKTNHAGGCVGGISNGNDIVFRVAVKPTSSTPQAQESYNLQSEKIEAFQVNGRHDLCIALRVPPVLEAIAALSITDLFMLK